MKSEKNKLDKVDEVSLEDLLNLIDISDLSNNAEQSREKVFDKITEKIGHPEKKATGISAGKLYLWRSVAASIIISAGIGFCFYTLGYKSGLKELKAAIIEVESPVNGILKITLPDGSEVTLNSGSNLTYPSFFDEKERSVHLEGEGYFYVQNNENKPFVVKSTGLNIQVLGTKFNLKSFEEDSCTWLTLEEGSVMAKIDSSGFEKQIILTPNEQIIINKESGNITIEKVYPGLFTGWLTGNLFFRNNTLEEITAVLEKRFNVEIIIKNNKLKKETYYCQFGKEDQLERILYLLANKGNWKYTFADRIIIIDQ